MKKKILAFLLCAVCIALPAPSFRIRKRRGTIPPGDPSHSAPVLPGTESCSCSDHSRTCAAAVAQVQAEKAATEALFRKCTALRDETAIAQRAALASANQAAASQAQTQNMTAVVIAIGAYCMYTHMKKEKKNEPDSLKTYYRKIYQHFSRKVRTAQRSQKKIRSFCVNCLPYTIKSYF